MFACIYLARSAALAYTIALSALCLGFATFVHFLVLCHPLARDMNGATGQQDEPAKKQADAANLGSVEEHLFMHACLAANLRTANILLGSGKVSKGYAAFVIRYLWHLGAETTQNKKPSQIKNSDRDDVRNYAVKIFELTCAVFPDFVSTHHEGPWAEILLAWARGGLHPARITESLESQHKETDL